MDDRSRPDRRPVTTTRVATARKLRRDMTLQEVKVWNWLRDRLHPAGWKFRRQVGIGPYIVDLASLRPKVVIEIDGDDHGTDAGRRCDAERDRFLVQAGFAVVRFWNTDNTSDGDAFVDALIGELRVAGIVHPLQLHPTSTAPSL